MTTCIELHVELGLGGTLMSLENAGKQPGKDVTGSEKRNVPSITRYLDAEDSDVFILSGAEDLVLELMK